LFVQLAQIEKSGRRRAQGADTLDVPWCKTPITRHREMLLPTSDPPHQVRLCPGNSPVSARCLVFPCGSHHIRTRLHPKSICIGETEFLDPETNLPKSPSGQKRSPQRPKRNRKSPPIAGSLAVSGKSRGSKECVVGPAEPLKLAPHPDQSSSKINLHRGNGIPRPRDRPPKIAFRPETVSAETETQPQEPANCGLFGRLREICRFEGLHGGPGRTRTLQQIVINRAIRAYRCYLYAACTQDALYLSQ
jgi:hypothetical protein